eukprot:TRINITY_DN2407_c0_g7_i1.p1 TRINITY_DN2407_c0_g7~~TRINITY_DN2407_c0_g7_i1.p1  ORF type:complete len:1021 (-),score=347.95 TRINITY_DN2407_c0_g7_i1:35-3097(-)
MGRQKRIAIPKKPGKKKPKGQLPPRPLAGTTTTSGGDGKGKKRKRGGQKLQSNQNKIKSAAASKFREAKRAKIDDGGEDKPKKSVIQREPEADLTKEDVIFASQFTNKGSGSSFLERDIEFKRPENLKKRKLQDFKQEQRETAREQKIKQKEDVDKQKKQDADDDSENSEFDDEGGEFDEDSADFDESMMQDSDEEEVAESKVADYEKSRRRPQDWVDSDEEEEKATKLKLRTRLPIIKDGKVIIEEPTPIEPTVKKPTTPTATTTEAPTVDLSRIKRERKRPKLEKDSMEQDEDIKPIKQQIKEELKEEEEEEQQKEPVPIGELKPHMLKPAYIKKRKLLMAKIGSSILSNPEEHIGSIKELHELTYDPNPQIRKLALLSELAIFKDILPMYKIRVRTQEELNPQKAPKGKGQQTQNQLTREVRLKYEFEKTLLKHYQAFLQSLETIIKDLTAKPTRRQRHKINKNRLAGIKDEDNDEGSGVDEGEEMEDKEATKMTLGITAVKCLQMMLESHPNFNYTNNIITILIPLMNNDASKICNIACEAITSIFTSDKTGETTLQTVSAVGNYIKQKCYVVKLEMLQTFTAIEYLDELQPGDVMLDGPVSLKKFLTKQERKKETNAQKKKRKEMEQIDAEMREARNEQNAHDKRVRQTEILRSVFVIYFRILKKNKKSPLLPAVLEGIAKYAVFISIDYLGDIIRVLEEVVKDGFLDTESSEAANMNSEISVNTKLQCILAAFQLTRQGGRLADALNVDLKDLYTSAYQLILEFPFPSFTQSDSNTNSHSSKLHSQKIADFDASLIKVLQFISSDKRNLSTARIASFIKRLCTVSLSVPVYLAVPILITVHKLLDAWTRTRVVLDSEFSGSGEYNPEVKDPEVSNALNTTVWEIPFLAKAHVHPFVRDFCTAFGEGYKDENLNSGWKYVTLGEPEAYKNWSGYLLKGLELKPGFAQPKEHFMRKIMKNRSRKNKGRVRKNSLIFVKPPQQKEVSDFMMSVQQNVRVKTEGKSQTNFSSLFKPNK